MELKPGYKQTEVGVIPADWDCKNLRELCKKITDGTHDTPRPVANGIPFLTAIHVKGGGIDYENCLYLKKEDHKIIFARCNPQRGDVLFVNIGAGVATTAVVSVDYEFSLKNVALLKPSAELSGSYLNYCLSSRKEEIVNALSSGGAQPFLSLSKIAKILIPAPSLAEQEAISETLNEIDALLVALERLIAKKSDIKRAAMQELLTGKRRLPGFEGEWEVKWLKDIIKIPVTDGPHMTPRFLDSGVPFLSVNNLVNNRMDFSDLRFISAEDHRTFSRKCKPQKGDILLGKAASVGKVAIVDTDTEFNIWSPIALVRIAENNSPAFIYYALQGQDLVGQISLLTNASSQGNIGMGDIEKLAFRLPGKEEQTAIASTLSELDAELAALAARMEKANSIQQGMMQQLLTGKIRLT